MIKHLRAYGATTTPRRCNDEWNAITESDRTTACMFCRLSLQVVVEENKLIARVNILRCCSCLWVAMDRRDKRRYMIKISVILVVAKNKDRFLPYFRVLREDVYGFGQIPCSIPRCTRVI